MKKIYLLSLILFTLSFFACSDDDEVTDLSLPNTVYILSQETTTLQIKGNGGYTASSSDENIVTASIDGDIITIKGKKVGEATITVKDKKDKTVKIEVKLHEDEYLYKIGNSEIYKAVGKDGKEIDENILNEIKEDIPEFYPAEAGNFYKFVRNNTYNGILTIHSTALGQPLYEGSFVGAYTSKNVLRFEIKDNAYFYYALKNTAEEKSVGGNSSAPFNFHDKLILAYDCTEYYKEKYPNADIEHVSFAQYIEKSK